jgi:hypothetical protein
MHILVFHLISPAAYDIHFESQSSTPSTAGISTNYANLPVLQVYLPSLQGLLDFQPVVRTYMQKSLSELIE